MNQGKEISNNDAFNRLLDIMRRLRGKGGCPWDREQTKETLKPYIIEETYEVLEAIDKNDSNSLKEELGDLLLQVLFLTTLAEESGDFTMDDVIGGISEKLVRRHPHVFADKKIDTAKDVVKSWASIKVDENKKKGRLSILEGVPLHMPALLRAHRVTEKASRIGFDWNSIDEVYDKLEEELKEFEEAIATKDREKMEDELGDVIFSLVNIARFLEVNPEEALKKTVGKFVRRFMYIEESLKNLNIDVRDAGIDEMERLWSEAKACEVKQEN